MRLHGNVQPSAGEVASVERMDWQRAGYLAVFLLILLAGTLILHSLRKKK